MTKLFKKVIIIVCFICFWGLIFLEKITDFFGKNVFSDSVMKERLPEDIYEKLKLTIKEGKTLDSSIADTVADAMKEWAIEKGFTF